MFATRSRGPILIASCDVVKVTADEVTLLAATLGAVANAKRSADVQEPIRVRSI